MRKKGQFKDRNNSQGKEPRGKETNSQAGLGLSPIEVIFKMYPKGFQNCYELVTLVWLPSPYFLDRKVYSNYSMPVPPLNVTCVKDE